MIVSAIITLKKDVLDPQGKVVQDTLFNLGMNNLKSIRQGKLFEIDVDEKEHSKALKSVDEMCKKLLANLVIENFKIIETQ